jgi:hypothetical protein
MKSVKNSCFECNKKLGLFAIKCKCNNIFCEKHRYAEKHICTYNYKENHKKELKKQLTPIIHEKVIKI